MKHGFVSGCEQPYLAPDVEIFFRHAETLKSRKFQHLEGLDYGISPDRATDFSVRRLRPSTDFRGFLSPTANLLRYHETHSLALYLQSSNSY